MSGMVTNTSVWLEALISIWEPATYGLPVNHSGWSAFMAGKEAILIGGATPFAMSVSAGIAKGMSTRGVKNRREGKNIDWRFPAALPIRLGSWGNDFQTPRHALIFGREC